MLAGDVGGMSRQAQAERTGLYSYALGLSVQVNKPPETFLSRYIWVGGGVYG